MKLSVGAETFRLAKAFTISRGSRTEARVVTVRLERDCHKGWGECVPYALYDETIESVIDQIEALPNEFDRTSLQTLLPAGAARNAVDCALWDLEAKESGLRAWDFAGTQKPGPEITAYTLSLDTAEAMEQSAQENAHRPLLKVKLGGPGDMDRVEAIRRGAPQTPMIVDANEGWSAETYKDLAPVLVRLGVKMVEQPLPADADDALRDLERVLPVCADESCHDRASLSGLRGKYDVVNIKLDKTGGLTEALALKDAAVADGFKVMTGCMVGSSLAMAPATLVAQDCLFTDLDGPLLLAEDRPVPLRFDEKGIHPPSSELWG